MATDPNYDPKDETHVRPQVGFRLIASTFDSRAFYSGLQEHIRPFHDAFTFAPENGEIQGTVRFAWDAPRELVDASSSVSNLLAIGEGSLHRVWTSYCTA